MSGPQGLAAWAGATGSKAINVETTTAKVASSAPTRTASRGRRVMAASAGASFPMCCPQV